MRGLALLAAVAIACASGRASAASCYARGPEIQADLDRLPWPTGAHPWAIAHCNDPDPTGCVLEPEGDGPAVAIVADPRPEFCDGAGADSYDPRGAYIRHYVPATPPPPGRYVMRCDGGGEQALQFVERTISAPTQIGVRSAEHVHRDTLCCDNSAVLVLDLSGGGAYLDDGGYVELLYDDGQRLPANGGGGIVNTGLLPAYGPIELTPVAADGARGDTVRVEYEDIDGALDDHCAIGPRPSRGLWLVLPLLYVHARRRRA